MAEASAVIGLISAIISIIDATKTLYDAAKDAKGQPEAFRQIAARLPLVERTLQEVGRRAQTLDANAWEALNPVVDSCSQKAKNLKKIFKKVLKKDDDNWVNRYKKVISTLVNGQKVESLMADILKDIQIIACEAGIATNPEVKEIEQAIQEMEGLPPSLQDDTGPAVTQNHKGSGNNNVNTGRGAQHNGTGDLYHNQISGDAHFGTGYRDSTFNVSIHNPKEREDPLRDLRTTDPRDDKMRIEQTKGGLLENLDCWVLNHVDFQRWRGDKESRLLWIKGDPGKGKTMLLCGIVNDMSPKSRLEGKKAAPLLSYFFCQATDERINNAAAVLRGLIFLLASQQPSLVSHVQKKYDGGVKNPFALEDPNSWYALSTVFRNILKDPSLDSAYLIIDALDECSTGLPELLNLIVEESSAVARIKWIVSSRNELNIEADLEEATRKAIISLELNEQSVSEAVTTYIQAKVDKLAKRGKYDKATRDAVHRHLSLNANETFLWVALVCEGLARIKGLVNISGPRLQKELAAFPAGLNTLYGLIIKQIQDSNDEENAKLCKRLLAVVSAVYRPVTIDELASLVAPEGAPGDSYMLELIGLCGSFLTIRERTVYFVHQSVKDFFLKDRSYGIFPSGIRDVHGIVFSRSLNAMSLALRRNIYGLDRPGSPVTDALPDPDPLAALRYSCINWVDHLCDWNPDPDVACDRDWEDSIAMIDKFIRQKYLYWLEALSLCKGGRVNGWKSDFSNLVQDSRRFIMYHQRAIEHCPLQTYASALLFSPDHSSIRNLFKKEEPTWVNVTIDPVIEKWSPCLHTIEGHRDGVESVVFSHDSTLLASADCEVVVKVWDANSGECRQTLTFKDNNRWVVFAPRPFAFSPDSKWIAVSIHLYDYDAEGRPITNSRVEIRDTVSGKCLRTLVNHNDFLSSVAFSHDSTRVTSASLDGTIKTWGVNSGECLHISELKNPRCSNFEIVTLSHDLTRLVSISSRTDIQIWDASSGNCLCAFTVDGTHVGITLSHDSRRVVTALLSGAIQIWDVDSGKRLQELEDPVDLVAFSNNSTRLASASTNTIKIWDVTGNSRKCLRTLEGHCSRITSLAFSHDSTRLASTSEDRTIKIWDIRGERIEESRYMTSRSTALQVAKGSLEAIAISPDSTRLALASDAGLEIWDPQDTRASSISGT
ncbi:hypothetical protein DRE_02650 [Drechslerella stenobrocha 248]|uniref:NACHT domain-containing protein n=1 Tax=Drechslerella stenobrocha 248 TaxID=1043628 RepID=W7HV62_9PEZI|nr:hypothetical protein DRE_02650 [Drechslerella stenobrocha 248]